MSDIGDRGEGSMMKTTRTRVPDAAASWPARRRVPFVRQCLVQTWALVLGWSRDPGIVVQSLVFPAFMLMMFQLVFGKTVSAMGGGGSIYGNAGLVALVGALFGSLATALSLIAMRESGLLSRMWTMPTARAGFVASRLLAEALRTLIATVVLFAVALTMGFRFDQGVVAGIAALLVPVIFVVGVVIPIIALAASASGQQAVQLLGGAFLFALFFNSGFAPITEYPGWLQPVVRYQPMTPAIDAIRGLTEGGAVAAPLLTLLAWTAGLALIFGPIAVRAFRKACEGE